MAGAGWGFLVRWWWGWGWRGGVGSRGRDRVERCECVTLGAWARRQGWQGRKFRSRRRCRWGVFDTGLEQGLVVIPGSLDVTLRTPARPASQQSPDEALPHVQHPTSPASGKVAVAGGKYASAVRVGKGAASQPPPVARAAARPTADPAAAREADGAAAEATAGFVTGIAAAGVAGGGWGCTSCPLATPDGSQTPCWVRGMGRLH